MNFSVIRMEIFRIKIYIKILRHQIKTKDHSLIDIRKKLKIILIKR